MNKKDLLLANLMVGNVKLHNLHWNVKGQSFKATHEYLETLYDQVFEWYDQVAEKQKMFDEFPKASVKKYLEISDIVELEDKDWTISEAITNAKELYTNFRKLAKEIREEEEEKGNFQWVSLMEDMVIAMDKEIWFMSQMLK